MANIKAKDADGNDIYLKSTNAGTDLDPHIKEFRETNSSGILADTSSIDTNVGTLAGAVSGTEVQVDIVSALPAGTNNIGDVDIASALPAGTNNIGDVDVVSITLPTAIYNGQNTIATAGTAEALASSQALTSGVTVKALAANTGLIFVGTSSVSSSNGFQLAAGESVFIEVDNLADVYVDAATSSDGVCYIAS